METVEDIVREMRDENFGCDECGDLCGECPNVTKIIKEFADRIHEAWKRELSVEFWRSTNALADSVGKGGMK